MDREEFYRLKKVKIALRSNRTSPTLSYSPHQFLLKEFSLTKSPFARQVSNKKQRDQAAADKELMERTERPDAGASEEPQDVLGTNEDDDVIF